MPAATPALHRLIAAILLAGLLTLAWGARDWSALMAFRLPDTDDMARLAQVRDWLDGQRFADLVQYRLGPPGGASMHWSRLGDIGPAAIIVALRPLLGNTGAEQAMVLVYPGALFAIAIALTASIAERMARGSGLVATLVAALAFPSSSLFAPGRIDHHGLQIVLMLAFARAIVANGSRRSGAAAGLAAATSLVVGLETLPLVLFGMAAMAWRWLAADASAGNAEWRRAGGFSIALAGTTVAALLLLRPAIWPTGWCDGFTPASSKATLIAAAAFAVLALAGGRAATLRARILVLATVGAASLPLALTTSQVCLSGPYGAIDPLLQRVWMGRVGEAMGLFAQKNPGAPVSYGTFGIVGLVALLAAMRRDRRVPAWQAFAILYVPAMLLTLAQIRATYIGSALTAVPVAVAIFRLRQATAAPLPRIAGWIVGAGLVWSLLGSWVDRAMAPRPAMPGAQAAGCGDPGWIAALGRLPTGRVAAPMNTAAYVLGGTRHAVIAAPYHRNNAGNLAMYRLFLSSPDMSRRVAARWRVDYLILCADDFAELGPMADDPRRLVGQLRRGIVPDWLVPMRSTSDGPLTFRTRDVLWRRPAPR